MRFRFWVDDPVEKKTQDPKLRYAQLRAEVVAQRADEVVGKLEARRERNHFAEGVAAAWGVVDHHRGGT